MNLVRRLFWIAVFVGILVFGWTFASNHGTPVTIELPWIPSFEVKLWLALLLAAGLGAVLSFLLSTYQIARLKLLSRRYRKMVERLEAEVHQLRNLPLGEGEPPAIPADAGASDPDAVAERALGRGA